LDEFKEKLVEKAVEKGKES